MLASYYRELLNFLARAVNDRDTAADLAQESCARVLAAQQAGREVRNPRALLYRTARNLLADRHRRAAVRGHAGRAEPPAGAAPEAAAPAALEPDAVLAARQRLTAVLGVIEQLPPRCREAFILHKFDGLSYAEIAQRMAISPRTVEMHLQSAMKACWACLDAQDAPPVTPPVTSPVTLPATPPPPPPRARRPSP